MLDTILALWFIYIAIMLVIFVREYAEIMHIGNKINSQFDMIERKKKGE